MSGQKKSLKHVKDFNAARFCSIKALLGSEHLTLENSEIALEELKAHPDGMDELYSFALGEYILKGKPMTAIVHRLKIRKGLSALAANYMCQNIAHEVTGSVNLLQEYTQLLNTVNHNIGTLHDHMEQATEDEDSSIDLSSLYAELRGWMGLKSNILTQALNHKVASESLAVEQTKADALSKLTEDELLDLIKKLGE